MSAGANELRITKTDDTTVTITDLTTIASSAAYTGQVAKGNVKSIVIGTDITSIGNDTFKDCTELLTATIGNKVTAIGVNAFQSCTKLTTVTFTAPASGVSLATTIGNGAFRSCSALNNVTIPITVTSIGESAFQSCSALATLTFATTSTLATISQFAFSSCTALTSVSIPDSVTTLANEVFNACSNLDTVFIGDGVTTINANTFNMCTKLQFLTIGTGVTSINASAFTSAGSGLASGTVLKVRMGSAAQTALGLTYGTGETFSGSVTATIVVDTAVLIITNASGLADEVVSSKTSISANDYTTTSSTIGTISIWPEITQISANAFQGCTGLTTVNFAITNTLATIQGFAFISCVELTGIDIPNSVTFIGANAFNNCAKLASVSLPSSNSSFTTLSDQVFRSCAKLTSITIPASVTNIGNSVFMDAGLTSVTIPDTVTSLGTGVFQNCTSLDTVVIGSGLESIGATTFNGCTKLRRTTIGDNVGANSGSIAVDAFTNAGSGLTAPVVLQVKMSATPLSALNLSYGVGVAFRGATNVTIVAEFVIPAPLSPDASCFPGNTPVQTDQGIVNICDLCPDKHTIRGNKIETVTQNTGIENFLILIKKDTLYPNVPSQDTYTTFDHNIFVNKQNIRAGVLETRAQESGIPDLMNRIYQVPYNGEVLYNVLLKDDKHDYMCVNNLIVETMSPKNIFAKYYCYLQNKKQGEENSELEESYKKYSSMTRALTKKHKRSRLTKK